MYDNDETQNTFFSKIKEKNWIFPQKLTSKNLSFCLLSTIE